MLVDDYSGYMGVSWLKDITSRTVIAKTKEHFARHGIPQVFMSDNGRQFSLEEFRKFAKEWKFEHRTSTPYYAQANDLAERNVQTVKQLMKKCSHKLQDVWLAILHFRASARDSQISSPGERLFSRKLRTTLPIDESLLKPKLQKGVQTQITKQRERSANYANRGRKDLRDLFDNEWILVSVGKKWKYGSVLQRINQRDYWVQVRGKQYRRNRYLLKALPKAALEEFEDSAQEAPQAAVESRPSPEPVRPETTKTSRSPKQSPWFDKKSGTMTKSRESRRGRKITPRQPYQHLP